MGAALRGGWIPLLRRGGGNIHHARNESRWRRVALLCSPPGRDEPVAVPGARSCRCPAVRGLRWAAEQRHPTAWRNIGAFALRVGVISSRSTWQTGGATGWCGISRCCAMRWRAHGCGGPSGSMRGWCCRTICTRFGRCLTAMTIFRRAGQRLNGCLRFMLTERNLVPLHAQQDASGGFGNGGSGNTRYATMTIIARMSTTCILIP